MYIRTEETPNPATLKFLPGRGVMDEGTLDIESREDAKQSPLAGRLFGVEGVRAVFLGKDFISVTKDEVKTWADMKPELLTAIVEHYASGEPAALPGAKITLSGKDEGDLVAQIRDLLDRKVRPALAQDGGDVAFQRFEDGIVYVTLKGACSGCPSASLTLKAGIESLLRHNFPEVREVRQVR